MDPATPPSPAPTPTLNGQRAVPFDWRAFWKAADAGAVIEVAHVTFNREFDARNLARLRSGVFKERVRFDDCRFAFPVDLSESRFGQSLHMEDCTFEQGLSLRDVDVRSRLSLRGTTLSDDARFWLDWRGLRVGADMSLICVTAHAPIDLYNAVIGADLKLDGLHALAKGKAAEEVLNNRALGEVDRHHVASTMAGTAINLEGADIRRHVCGYTFGNLQTTIKGKLDLRAKVEGDVRFGFAIIDAGTDGTAVNMGAAEVAGSVFFHKDTRITGMVDLRAKVAGQVAFDNAVIDAGTDGTAVNMDAAEVAGSVFFVKGTRITGMVDLRAKVAGQVAFSNAVIDAGTGGKAVNMDAAVVGGAVFFRGGTRVTGTVDLRAKVAGQVSFNNAVIDAGTGGKAVNMGAAVVGGAVFFRGGTRVTGTVDLRAKVTGNVEFERASITAETAGTAVMMLAAEIGGSVFFVNGTRVTGKVDLRAKVAGQVNFKNVVINGLIDNTAIEMAAAEVGESVFFENVTRVTGQIDLRAKVTGQVSFKNTVIEVGAGGTAVFMEAAEIGRSVFFIDGTRVMGKVDLRAKVKGQVVIKNTIIDAGNCRRAVCLDNADIGGPCFIRGNTIIVGGVSLLTAKLHGGLICSNTFHETTFGRPGSGGSNIAQRRLLITGGMDLSYADVIGPVEIHRASVLGEIKARHLSVHGDFHFCGGVVGEVDKASREECDTFVKEYRVRHAEHITAEVAIHQNHRLRNTRTLYARFAARQVHEHLNTILPPKPENEEEAPTETGWRLWDTKSTPAKADQTAIDLELADIHGNVWIKGSRVLGTIKAEAAEIVGDADFDRTIVSGKLSLRSATVSGSIKARDLAFVADKKESAGKLDARGAKAAELHLYLGSRKETADTLNLNQDSKKPAAPPRRVLLDRADFGTLRVEGTVKYEKGNEPLCVHRTAFRDLVVDGFNADGLEPDPPVRMEHCVALAVLVGAIVLACAYAYDDDGWRWMIFVQLAVIGSGIIFWLIDDLRRSEAPPATPVLDFLACTHFSPVFYVTVERSAREAGMEPLADEVYLRRRRRELKDPPYTDAERTVSGIRDRRTSHSAVTRVWRRWVLDFVFGYGVRTVRVGTLFVLLWLLNWAVFLPAYSVERPLSFEVGAETDAAETSALIDARRAQASISGDDNPWPGEGGRPGPEDHWGAQRAFFMALRLQIPLVDLFIDKPWKPADRAMFADGEKTGGIGLTYENYAAAMRAINLILVPVVIAGAAGFLKRRDTGENGT